MEFPVGNQPQLPAHERCVMKRFLPTLLCSVIFTCCIQSTQATIIYSQGFETDNSGWDAFGGSFDATRVPSGTNGITSASGGFHAESTVGTGVGNISAPPTGAGNGSAGNLGGYNFGAGGGVPTPFQPFVTSVDIFLDVDGGWANETRLDLSSAINNSDGDFLRDFVFNVGFYDDARPVGTANTDRFLINTGNNASADTPVSNAGAVAIEDTGWYTFEHRFFDNGGVLNTQFNVFDSSDVLVNSWILGNSGIPDPTAGVGGNRYQWFVNNGFTTLAFDNSTLELADTIITPPPAAIPEPSSIAFAMLGGIGLFLTRVRRRRKLEI